MKNSTLLCNLFIGCLALCSVLAVAEDKWPTEHPPKSVRTEPGRDIRFIEVPASKLSNALRNLEDKKYINLNKGKLDYYIGYQPIEHKAKYVILIRAVYMNGELGQFITTQFKDSLWIRFGTYGNISEIKKSALIVFVDTLPNELYITTDTR